MKRLEPNEKIDVPEILKDLDQYRPKRKGWTWRKTVENQKTGPFELKDTSENLKHSGPLFRRHRSTMRLCHHHGNRLGPF